MDVNLTGQVAANLVQNPIMIMGAGAIGGLVTGILTLLGVWITQKQDAKQNDENRKEKERIMRREERKRAYIQFFVFITTMDSIARTKDTDAFEISTEELVKNVAQSSVEIMLLSPEISSHITKIRGNYPDLDSKDNWLKYSKELKKDVLPFIQNELNTWSDEGKETTTSATLLGKIHEAMGHLQRP